MNKNLLLIVGLAVVALGAFFFFKKPAGPSSGAIAGNNQTVSASVADLMALGEDYTCTFDTTDEVGMEQTGTVAVADKGLKFNGQFVTTQTNGVTTKYNVIRDGEYTYFWSAADSTGYKMKIDPASESLWGDKDNEPADEAGFDEDRAVDFTCSPLSLTAGLFTAPADIEFMDMSAQMEVMQQQMDALPAGDQDSMNGQYCSACNSLEGSAKTQCLAAMGC